MENFELTQAQVELVSEFLKARIEACNEDLPEGMQELSSLLEERIWDEEAEYDRGQIDLACHLAKERLEEMDKEMPEMDNIFDEIVGNLVLKSDTDRDYDAANEEIFATIRQWCTDHGIDWE
jgi:hypothetical protein